MKNYRKLFKVVGIAAAWVLLSAWFLSGALDNTAVNWPRQPMPEAGRTIPYEVKGITVYITEADRSLVAWLRRTEIASGVTLFLAILLSGEWRRIASPSSKQPTSR
jgi:hypothetical protein